MDFTTTGGWGTRIAGIGHLDADRLSLRHGSNDRIVKPEIYTGRILRGATNPVDLRLNDRLEYRRFYLLVSGNVYAHFVNIAHNPPAQTQLSIINFRSSGRVPRSGRKNVWLRRRSWP